MLLFCNLVTEFWAKEKGSKLLNYINCYINSLCLLFTTQITMSRLPKVFLSTAKQHFLLSYSYVRKGHSVMEIWDFLFGSLLNAALHKSDFY